MKIVVIGGGAAGFFAAITAAETNRKAEVILLEKSTKLLSKVRISGGGRCNVTHACFDNRELVKNYPRGARELRSPLEKFTTSDTIAFFEDRGVPLKIEEDGRMFPVTDSSESVAGCLLDEARRLSIRVRTFTEVYVIEPLEDGRIKLFLPSDEEIIADKVIVASGGSPKESGLQWLKELGHHIEKPVPSLFTFNMPGNKITQLMGVSVPMARVKIEQTKQVNEGPLLITHWGMSGPAILKLSAWGARELAKLNYKFNIRVNWLCFYNEEEVREELQELKKENATKLVFSRPQYDLPKSLWHFLCSKAGIADSLQWANLNKNQLNALVQALVNDLYEVNGKTTFKEEFVTCGGVSLRDVDMKTMQSKVVPNLYFAGEVLDIDGITGGFNFQAAWTTGFIAGKSAAESLLIS